MGKIPFFFIVIIAVIITLASFRYFAQRRDAAQHALMPLVNCRVAVIAKREVPVSDRRSRQRQVTPVEDMLRYDVDFDPTDGGAVLTFRLSAAQYRKLSVGDTGTLRYRGSHYEGFFLKDAAP